MRWFGLAVLGMAACNGDGDDALGPSGEDTVDTPIVIECDLPQYDLTTLACNELAFSFEQLVRAASDCNVDADCQILRPACEQWDQVECYYSANSCLTQETLSAYNAEGSGCSAIGQYTFVACTCGDEPTPRCSDHSCIMEEP